MSWAPMLKLIVSDLFGFKPSLYVLTSFSICSLYVLLGLKSHQKSMLKLKELASTRLTPQGGRRIWKWAKAVMDVAEICYKYIKTAAEMQAQPIIK